MRPSRSAALAGALLLTLAGCSAGRDGGATAPAPAAERVAFHGVEPSPVPSRPSFVLSDTSGRRFDFARETGGRPTYLYFGYTSCPDECPTAMADVAAALRRSPAELREQVRVVFVTTDPERDTGPVLRRWLDQFDPTVVGLTGSASEVEAAQRAAGLRPASRGGELPTLPGRPDAHVHAPGTAAHEHFAPLGYAVDHANVILAYDAEDRHPVRYPGGVLPADIAADLPVLARQEEPT